MTIVVGAALDRLDRGRDRCVAGQQQDAQTGTQRFQFGDQGEAVVGAELEIEHGELHRLGAYVRERLRGVVCDRGGKPARTERAREHACEHFVVVDQQYAVRGGCRHREFPGKVFSPRIARITRIKQEPTIASCKSCDLVREIRAIRG